MDVWEVSSSGGSSTGRKLSPVVRFLRALLNCALPHSEDNCLDDIDLPASRYKPEGLPELSKATKFTQKELKLMYRGFKQECPTGLVDENTFKEIYAQYFPQGNSSQYATFVFNTFDIDKNGSVSFEEFVANLSVLSRGTVQEKLRWTFTLYDINNDGVITRDEMLDIVNSIYMMNPTFTPLVRKGTISAKSRKHHQQHHPSHHQSQGTDLGEISVRHHVDIIFQKMDRNRDGVISLEEFMDTCSQDSDVIKSMGFMDTMFY